ncbi:ArnT family glycosyltransferase [Pontibacter anaerobius]|uniref:Glycosyltransferase family 39 protein n=1 Tax=Pontibacter anaerobius TaxID=2993940 RepID=A0ABT3RCR7_9BACT|nr:glycosyltransferase family 39 protein [Pontibacter anaerobius]MCX2739239.1 glycosyltransferase family 39 protein [Pontibacter anaerobius]
MDTKYKSTSETIFKARHLLVLMLVFAVIYFLGAHEGIYYSDDLAYSEFAGRLVNGTFDVTDNGHTFIHRPTVFVPISILYHLFGVNILTYSFWPFLCTIGCIYITYKVAHQHDLNAAVASVFLAFTFYFIYFINFLYPDNIVAFFVLIAASTYFSVLYGENNKHLFKAIVFTTSLFLAGLTKETAVVVLPFFMYHAIRAFMKRSALQKFWVYSLVTGLVLLLSYFTWYYIETGDPFYRISEMEKANMVYDNYLNNPSKSYFPRLTVAPIEVLISTGSFITLIFLLGGEKMLEDTDLKKKYYWLFLFLTAYLTLNFSSTSLSVYNPIKLDARMFNLVLPALAISASYGFNKKLNSIKFTLAYTLIFSLTAIYLTNKVGVIYGLLALYFAAHAAWLYFGYTLNLTK